ncbi:MULTISPECIES: hypothetical protein [Corynebacterium]|nr:hypothetical protein [Corynebacterium hadale]
MERDIRAEAAERAGDVEQAATKRGLERPERVGVMGTRSTRLRHTR